MLSLFVFYFDRDNSQKGEVFADKQQILDKKQYYLKTYLIETLRRKIRHV